MNSQREQRAFETPIQAVRFCTVERDAQEITGRPNVYLHDLLQSAIKSGSEQVVIINSDILLAPVFDLARTITMLQPGCAIVAKRIDITNTRDLSGKRYSYGFDFFAMHIQDAMRIEDSGLIYGMPWWDHYVICSLCLLDIRIELIQEPFAFHLVHEDRWNWDLWNEIGKRYADFLRDKLARLEPASGLQVSGHAEELRSILFRKPNILRRLQQRLWPGKNHQLHELSRAVDTYPYAIFARNHSEFKTCCQG